MIASEEFEKLTSLESEEYECCVFKNCDFSTSDFSRIKFLECEFKDCNLSNVLMGGTSFLDSVFHSCKMLGIQFDHCNTILFSATFNDCQLDHSSFYQMNLRQVDFQNSKLEGVDFTESDLKGIQLKNCDLLNAKFERTILEETDFHGSFHLLLDPELNQVKKAKFSLSQLPGLLIKYNLKIDLKSKS
ncbi:MAG: pentapeptide repeat-containing protein [Bacteroidota bacterium]